MPRLDPETGLKMCSLCKQPKSAQDYNSDKSKADGLETRCRECRSRETKVAKKRFIDLTGQRFGMLTVIKRTRNHVYSNGSQQTKWLCKCDCGNQISVTGGNLRTGNSTKCRYHAHTPVRDRTGERYGRLLITGRGEDYTFPGGQSQATWVCECDCGNMTTVQASNLSRSRSCGCGIIDALHARALPEGEAARRKRLRSYQKRARDRGYSWELSDEEFTKLVLQDCYYCGAAPAQTMKPDADTGDFIYNGIDRVDNSEGYTFDNVVTCCGPCNFAKHTRSLSEFLTWANRVARLHPLEETS